MKHRHAVEVILPKGSDFDLNIPLDDWECNFDELEPIPGMFYQHMDRTRGIYRATCEQHLERLEWPGTKISGLGFRGMVDQTAEDAVKEWRRLPPGTKVIVDVDADTKFPGPWKSGQYYKNAAGRPVRIVCTNMAASVANGYGLFILGLVQIETHVGVVELPAQFSRRDGTCLFCSDADQMSDLTAERLEGTFPLDSEG